MTAPLYEVLAIKYAELPREARSNFLDGDAHETQPMPLDYFVWVVRNQERTIVVDTGFTEAVAKKRKRKITNPVAKGLKAAGVDPKDVRDVVITHLHYDHCGNDGLFPNARYHLQDDEMQYATGRHMRHRQFNHGYEVEEVVGMVRMVYKDRVVFHKGEAELAPGLTVHRIGGHTHGLQCVRVHTRRGWVVLASDTSHFYEHFEKKRAFTTMFHLGEALEGYDTLRRLADSERVVLDLVPRRRRHLEERVGLDRHLLPGQRPVDAVELEGGGDVDRDDLRVRVGRADEVDVAGAVPADVVEEDALALDEPLVLLARDRLADVALLQLGGRGGGLGGAHAFALVIASTISMGEPMVPS